MTRKEKDEQLYNLGYEKGKEDALSQLKDLVDVQPMTSPVGEIFYPDIEKKEKLKFKAGDRVRVLPKNWFDDPIFIDSGKEGIVEEVKDREFLSTLVRFKDCPSLIDPGKRVERRIWVTEDEIELVEFTSVKSFFPTDCVPARYWNDPDGFDSFRRECDRKIIEAMKVPTSVLQEAPYRSAMGVWHAANQSDLVGNGKCMTYQFGTGTESTGPK